MGRVSDWGDRAAPSGDRPQATDQWGRPVAGPQGDDWAGPTRGSQGDDWAGPTTGWQGDDWAQSGSGWPGQPAPPAPPATALPSAAPPRRRRRWLVAVCVTLATLLVLAGLAVAYSAWRVGQVHRIAVDGLSPVGAGSPQTILVVGTDSRAGESAAAAQHFGSAQQVTGQRSDVIILVHIDPGHAKVSLLSVPRDLFVPIAGTGTSNRINVALGQSPGVLVKTIEQALGVTINHYAQENFAGLQGLTDAVGGVCMSFPYPARDGSPSGTGNESGLNIATAGKHVLDGAAALALVRSRYYQYEANGTWHAEGTGDIGRVTRQHEYMRALLSKAVHASSRNPFTANAFLGKAVHNVSVDSSFTGLGLVRLALHLRSVKPGSIPSWTLPYRAVNNYRGYGDVLFPVNAQSAVIAAWQSYGSNPGTAATTPAANPSPAATPAAATPSPVPPWDPQPC
jgi:LCP family protein required for cell wall assembly